MVEEGRKGGRECCCSNMEGRERKTEKRWKGWDWREGGEAKYEERKGWRGKEMENYKVKWRA